MNKTWIIIPILLAFFFLPGVFATNFYEQSYFTSNVTGNPQTNYGLSFRTDSTNCTATFTVLTNITASGSFSMTTEYYSPDSTIIGSSFLPGSGNYLCLPQGSVSTTTGIGKTYEGKTKTTLISGTSHTNTLESNYLCGTSSDWINISTSGYDKNSYGYSPNVFFEYACINGPPNNNFFVNDTTQYNCGGLADRMITGSHYFCCGVGCVASNQNLGWWAMPFTTGASGIIEYEYDSGSLYAAFEKYGYYETADPSGTFIELTSTNDRLYLKADTNYVFYSHGTAGTGGGYTPTINISINVYTPSWLCSDWSECSSGQQFRTCTDPSGKVPAKIEYQGCLDEALASAVLGFEDYIDMSAYPQKECNKLWWPLCGDGVVNVNWNVPVGWYVVNPYERRFIDMSTEAASEGSRSLKMWYIPPSTVPDSATRTYCNWSNEGSYPQIYQDVSNTTFSIQYNITFPSSYMTFDIDTKACLETPIKYDGWCGKECYGYQGNCTEIPSGKYIIILFDTVTLEHIVEYYGEAGTGWGTTLFDVSDKGIIPGRDYRLVLAISPETVYDGHANCVYFDNLKYSVRASELSCETPSCVGIDRYVPHLIDDVCVYDIEKNSPECLSGSTKTKAENYQDYCIPDTLTLNHYNNATGEWEQTLNSSVCIAESEESGIYEPNTFDQLLDFSYLIYAPIVISLIIAVVGAGILVWKIKVNEGSGLIFIVTFLSILTVESLVGLFPIWFVIVLIVVSGAAIAFYMSRTMGG